MQLTTESGQTEKIHPLCLLSASKTRGNMQLVLQSCIDNKEKRSVTSQLFARHCPRCAEAVLLR